MLNKKHYIWVVAAIVALLPIRLSAQTQMQTINTFSSYTMYGLGELQTQGSLTARSMGGAGIAQRNGAMMNILNPAAYSMAIPKAVLFNFGMEGSSYFASQNVGGQTLKNKYTTVNFHDIALQVPIARGLGFGFSLAPYSSVGYRHESSSLEPNVGYVESINTGSGDVTEVKFGVGWALTKRLSIGVAAQYYWGDIDRYFSKTITGITPSSTALSTMGLDNISVSKIKGQAGIQYSPISNEKRKLTLAATYDIGGDLSPRSARVISAVDGADGDIYAQNDTTRMSLVMPRQSVVGFSYNSSKLVVAGDVSYQNWLDLNEDVEFTDSGMKVAYNNVLTMKLGMEYTPRRTDVRKYYNRVSYRLGARLGGYQYTFGGEELKQYTVTAGVGLPFNIIGISKIDLGVEWGSLGSTKSVMVDNQRIGLVKQNQLKFSLGFTMFGDDYWFVRQQIN